MAVTAGERLMAKATARRGERVLGWCAFLAVAASAVMSLAVAPPDAEQGNVQRLLQSRDGITDGRLAAMQGLRGLRKATLIDDGGQDRPLLESGPGKAHIFDNSII